VELLVVIGIIALLAALVTPAVMQAQVAARNAAIKVEIDMLHMAIMQYKNEYGSFPPAISGTATNDLAARHILRLFPRTDLITNEVTARATPLNSIVGWLSGYTDDPIRPISGGNRNRIYDFDRARLDNTQTIYFPSGKPGSPYIYINSSLYMSGTWPRSPDPTPFPYTVGSGSTVYSIPANTYQPVLQSGTTYFNPTTFQILCAGRDGEWGSDDDLSNFWPRTRGEYKDSLNQ